MIRNKARTTWWQASLPAEIGRNSEQTRHTERQAGTPATTSSDRSFQRSKIQRLAEKIECHFRRKLPPSLGAHAFCRRTLYDEIPSKPLSGRARRDWIGGGHHAGHIRCERGKTEYHFHPGR